MAQYTFTSAKNEIDNIHRRIRARLMTVRARIQAETPQQEVTNLLDNLMLEVTESLNHLRDELFFLNRRLEIDSRRQFEIAVRRRLNVSRQQCNLLRLVIERQRAIIQEFVTPFAIGDVEEIEEGNLEGAVYKEETMKTKQKQCKIERISMTEKMTINR